MKYNETESLKGGFGRIVGERGTPQWWLGLMTAFESLRDEECGEVWRAVEERYRQRANRGWRYRGNDFTLKVVRPPRVYSMVHAADAALLYNQPKFFTQPTSEEYSRLAAITEPLINGIWRRYVADSELQLVVRDAVKFGRGWSVVGYEDDYAKAKKARARRRREARQTQADPMFRVLPSTDFLPDGASAQRGIDNPVEPPTYENDARALWKKPSFRRVSPWDIFFDPDATVPEKMRWVARRIIADVDSVRRDPRFADIEGIEDLQPTLMLDGRNLNSGPTRYGQRQGILTKGISAMTKAFSSMLGHGRGKQDYFYVEMFDVHFQGEDGRWGRKLIANGFEHFLDDTEELYEIGNPFSSCAWNGDGETLFTTSDVEQVMTQIIEEEQLRTRLHGFMLRRADQPTLIDKRLLGGVNTIEILTAPKLGSYIPVEGLGNNQALQTGVAELPKRWELGETLAYLQRIDTEFADATGLGPSQRLQAMKSDTSAAEAQNVNRASMSRLSDKQKGVERYCVESARNLAGLAAQFAEASSLATFLGKEDVADWLATDISPGDIQDGLHIYIEKGSMTPQSDERRSAFYQMVLELWKDPVIGQKFDGDVAIERLAEMFGVPDLDRLLKDGVDIDDLRNQMMQMAAMQQGGTVPPAGPEGGGEPLQEAV